MTNDYKGLKWYKCDFHLHTTASKCFKDKSITDEQWVDAAIKSGLDCIAITDHNSGNKIDEIKSIAERKGLVVFPGVEITCDTSKIHLLVIFDVSAVKTDIEDFLIRCNIDRKDFGQSETCSSLSVSEVSEIANEMKAIIIPAHIDEFNGLGYCASRSNVDSFFQLEYIYAAQIVHKEFTNDDLKIKGNTDLVETINKYYNNSLTAIGQDNIRDAYNGVQSAKKHNIKLLTFSDNPDATEPSKHGIDGIGKTYSWIKMDIKPNIESLRQALMMHERSKNYFESVQKPYKTPSLWINKITVQNTSLTRTDNIFSIDFNPQLTTIIGGRGSGKSSILRFLRGVFKKEEQLEELSEVFKDHKDFFKKTDANGHGVLKEDTKIEVYFTRDEIEYRIVYTQSSPNLKIERFNIEQKTYEEIEDPNFVSFFDFEEYSQKQIFAIAQKPNSLRERIDSNIQEIKDLKEDAKLAEYKSLMARKRELEKSICGKSKINTIIKDAEDKIILLKSSGISDMITREQEFKKQKDIINSHLNEITTSLEKTQNVINILDKQKPIDYDLISEKYRDEIKNILSDSHNKIYELKNIINEKVNSIKENVNTLETKLNNTSLYKESKESSELLLNKKTELEANGINDISDFQKYNSIIDKNKQELDIIKGNETEIENVKKQINASFSDITNIRSNISDLREKFVIEHINSNKIKITIKRYSDQLDFENKFRRITQKSNGFNNGMDTAKKSIFTHGNIIENLGFFKKTIRNIHSNNYMGSDYDGHFINMIKNLTEEQIDEINLLFPEDEIEMKYKNRSGNFASIAVASAGQKTTAILTFILAFGDTPLILDQPEDDLDNRLVYDLIVDKIKKIKERRQVIIVTHNANIPVNGDAEYVISMSTDSRYLKIQAEGSIENNNVKNEICEVMEGGIEAFKTREKRYKSIGQ